MALTRAVLLCLALLAGCAQQGPEHQGVVPDGDTIRIPLGAVSDGGVHFFTYKYGGKNVNFFVRTDGAGQLHAHFDACYSCFKYKLGYVWKERQVVCIACGIGYDLDTAEWDYIGACVPISLNSRVVGDSLVINRRSLENGAKFF